MALRLKLKLDGSHVAVQRDGGAPVPTVAEYLAYVESQRERRTVAVAQARTSHTLDALDVDALRTLTLDEYRARLDVPSSQGATPRTHTLKLTRDDAARRIRRTPAQRVPRTSRTVALDDAYAGTLTRDGVSQDATRHTLARHTLERTVALSDTVESHPDYPDGVKLTRRTRSRVARRTLDDSVHDAHTLDIARNYSRGKEGN